jgi:hypothetical protein
MRPISDGSRPVLAARSSYRQMPGDLVVNYRES